MKFFAILVTVFATKSVSVSFSKETLQTTNKTYSKRLSQDVVDSRIIHGKEIIPHSKPYLAYLVFTVTDTLGSQTISYCAGSLVSENYILTAGHCTYTSISVDVYLGVHNILANETTQEKLTSTSFITHENFDASTKTWDIGLVKLTEPAKLKSVVQLAVLPSLFEATHPLAHRKVTMFGWGLTAANNSYSSEVPMEASTTVLPNELCASAYDLYDETLQLCTSGFEGQGACNGDSGGPLENEFGEVIGIVSYRASKCVDGTPTVFTKVGGFLGWIEKHSDVIIL